MNNIQIALTCTINMLADDDITSESPTVSLALMSVGLKLTTWTKKLFYDIQRISEQGKSEGFDSCDRPSNLTQIGFKSSIFQPV